jgi:hypothetical protein
VAFEGDDIVTNGQTGCNPDGGRVFTGILIILVGATLLMDRMDIGKVAISHHHWPLLLLALGAARILWPGRRRSRLSAAWLLYVGCWGLVNELHLFGLDYDTSWPLMIVGAGLATVWRALDPAPPQPRAMREI